MSGLTDAIPGVAQVKAALRFVPWLITFGALVFAAIQYSEARHWRKEARDAEKQLSRCVGDKAALEFDVKRRAEAHEAAKRQAARDTAEADARYAATADRIARLKALAASGAGKNCKAPPALLEALEGL